MALQGERCELSQTHFGVFLARKLHPAATILVIFLSLKWCALMVRPKKKDSCTGNKCRNAVRAFKK